MNRAADSSEGQARIAAIQQRLQQLGWSDGQNLLVDVRWGAEDPDLERKGAAELAALAPDVVLAGGTLSVIAMLHESRTIPVVFAGVADPVGLGVVASLSHPGGNATGFSSYEYSLAGKLLELHGAWREACGDPSRFLCPAGHREFRRDPRHGGIAS